MVVPLGLFVSSSMLGIFKGLEPIKNWSGLSTLLLINLGVALQLPPAWTMKGGFHYYQSRV
jgi:hypothetical protein